jgi:hypothetical protein
MKSLIVISVAASAVCAFASCDKRPAAKFRAGDRARVKLTKEEGTVYLRTGLSREYIYWLTLPGRYSVRLPVGKRIERAMERDRMYAESVGPYGPVVAAKWADDWDDPRPYHTEGPFYEKELEPPH